MKNQKTGLFEAKRFYKLLNFEIIATGKTQAEANIKLHLKLDRIRKHLVKKTKRGTWARPELVPFINSEIDKNNKEKNDKV